MNNFSAVGRIGKDAVTRHTQGGKAVTGFSLAVDRGWGENKQTIWLDCSAWGDRWEKVAPYLLKGSQIAVAGEIGTREHDGKTYVTLDVRDVTLVGGKSEAPKQQRQSPAASNAHDDDIPF